MIETFHFIRPWWLLLAPLGIAVVVLLWNRRREDSNWEKICDAHLVGRLLVGHEAGTSRIPLIALGTIWVVTALALAGPTWERLPQPVYSANDGRIAVLDLSRSMDSTDVLPSRLVRARFKLADLLSSGSGLQQGLVVFAGDAFTVSPLTDDIDTLMNLVPALDTRSVPVQGSESHLAISMAVDLLEAAGIARGEVVLIADELSPESREAAKDARSRGHRVSVLAVGTTRGKPIPLPQGGLLKDGEGNIVVPALAPDAMREVAQTGGGKYVEMTDDDHDIELLNSVLMPSMAAGVLAGEDSGALLKGDQWADKGPWLLLPLLLAVAMAFRQNWILLLLIFIVPLTPQRSHAFDWNDLWQRSDQQAAKQFKHGEFDQIPSDAPYDWRGAASYRAGKYDGAASAFASAAKPQIRDHYNLGNALAKQGEFQEAIAAYDRALQIDPGMEDASFNRNLVESLMQSQQSSPQSGEEESPKSAENSSDEADQRNESDSPSEQSGDDGDERNEQTANQSGNEDQTDQSRGTSTEQSDQESSPTGNEQELATDLPESPQPDSGEEDDPMLAEGSGQPLSEKELELEHWLRRIPDDPGGLLRRKFAWQYGQRPTVPPEQQW